MVRWGLFALFAVGAFATVAGAAPLSCPEGIEPTCTLAEDPTDVLHALATGGEIVATVLAFLFLGLAQPSLGDRHFTPSRGEMAITRRRSAAKAAIARPERIASAWKRHPVASLRVARSLTQERGVSVRSDSHHSSSQ
jgi:hypothetical protein